MIDEPTQAEQFVSEPVKPVPGTSDVRAMGRGEPGLPARFVWRDQEYAVAAVLKVWKTSSREGGTGELYLRRHWYTAKTQTGETMTVYCERQARDRTHPKSRWWLYTIPRCGGLGGDRRYRRNQAFDPKGKNCYGSPFA